MKLSEAYPGTKAWKTMEDGHIQMYCFADVVCWRDKGFRLWIGEKDQGRLYKWSLFRVLWLWWKLR